MGGPPRKGSWKMGGHRLPPVVRGYRPSDVGATTNLTSSGGHYRPWVVSQKVCKAECLFELQKYLFFSLCFP